MAEAGGMTNLEFPLPYDRSPLPTVSRLNGWCGWTRRAMTIGLHCHY